MQASVASTFESSFDRLKSGQACRICRKRKNKCDGRRPSCNFCSKRGLECVYNPVYKLEDSDRRYVDALEEKVWRLERALRQSQSSGDGGSYEQGTGSTAAPSRTSDTALVQGFQVISQSIPEVVLGNTMLSGPQARDTSFEIDQVFEQTIRYSEISINSALTDFGLAPAVSETSPSQQSSLISDSLQEEAIPEKNTTTFITLRRPQFDGDLYTLPSQALARRLVDLFFENVYALLPLIHEATFRKRFAAIYDNNRARRAGVPFLALLNIIFAYGCDYLNLDVCQIYRLSQTFHYRASGLIHSVCYETATLEVVQALHLVTLHLNSNMQFHRMWTNTGLLVRTAQALGLHLDPSDLNISKVEKEMRKRLWWSIYALDRFISLKYCRLPAMSVESRLVGLPSTTFDDQLVDQGQVESSSLPKRGPSPMHSFNALCELIQISETVLISTYKNTPWFLPMGKDGISAQGRKPEPVQLYTQIALLAEQEGNLAAWLAGLPEHLRFTHCKVDMDLKPEQQMLQIRYLHARLMIHRQNLIWTVRHEKEKTTEWKDNFLQTVIMATVHQCVECACDLVNLVTEYSKGRGLRPWWLNTQFLFTSLAILFTVLPRRNITHGLDINAVNTAIDNAMLFLHSLGDICQPLSRCREYFESLKSSTVVDRSAGLDNPLETRTSTAQGVRSSTVGTPGDMTMNQPNNSLLMTSTQSADTQDDDFSMVNMDQMIIDYSSSTQMFSDPLFCDINFGQFNMR